VDEPRVVKPKKTKPPQPSASESDPTDEEDGQKAPEPQDDSPRGRGARKTVTLAPVKKSAGSSVAKLTPAQVTSLDEWCSLVNDFKSQMTIDFLKEKFYKNSKTPESTVQATLTWFAEHTDNPYPSPDDLSEISEQTNMADFRIIGTFNTFRTKVLAWMKETSGEAGG
jgi:hypothetical protein